MPLPGGGVLNKLPWDGDLLALTVDDGVNTDVVRLYTQFAKDTGVRLTYFVNGNTARGPTIWHCYGPWWSPARFSWATTPGRIRT